MAFVEDVKYEDEKTVEELDQELTEKIEQIIPFVPPDTFLSVQDKEDVIEVSDMFGNTAANMVLSVRDDVNKKVQEF